MSDVIRVCKTEVPQEIAWDKREHYGDYGIPNYNADVKRVLYCVTPTAAVVDYFRKGEYDLLISHHPFRVNVPQLILHTALDCCEGGLNDQWRDHLGMLPGYSHFDGTLGWIGEIAPIPFEELVQKVGLLSGKVEGQVFKDASIKTVKTVVICSGLGGLVNHQASQTGADCYLLGQATADAQDMGFKAVIETGHTASEWMGVLLFRRILAGVTVDLAPANIDVFGCEFHRPRKGAQLLDYASMY